jgi:hypothetical protein
MIIKLKEWLGDLVVSPVFSLVATAVLMIASQLIPLLSKLSDGQRNSVTVVIGFAGLWLTGYAAIRQIVRHTQDTYLDKVIGRVDQHMVGQHKTLHSSWDDKYFLKVLSDVTRGDDRGEQEDEEDVRITTTAFSSGAFPEDILSDLVHSGVRVKVILMNPESVELIRSRNQGRTDGETKEGAIEAIRHQIERLSNKRVFPEERFSLRLSDLMPVGFVLHTKEKAIMGLMLAHTSFVRGPMIEVDSTQTLWRMLKEDWKVRWSASVDPNTSKNNGKNNSRSL